MKKLLFTAFAAVLIFAACEKPLEEIYGPSSKLEGINDDWTLAKVEQYDPKNKDLVIDVSSVFANDNVELNVESENFTFAFNQDNPLYMGTNGTWSFDDNEAPSQIDFASVNGSDTTHYVCPLLRTVRTTDPTLEFALTRECESGTPTTVYHFTFQRK